MSAPDADDSETPILHIDMDAFFASVSLLKHPEHVGKPVLIGSLEGRSVVSSANYEARRYGIGAAMPVARAVQLCPAVVVLDGDFEDYRHYSNIVMEIFREFTPIVEPLSIDEAFLDVSGSRRLLGSPSEIGAAIRTRVRDQTGLACTVGIAATKFVAKIASGKGKPDGLLVIPKHRTQEFLRPLPIRALWGVGAKTAESLERQALRTVADIADAPDRLLERTVGKAAAIKLQQLARGIDHRRVEPARPEEKSASHEVTFSQDITDVAVLQRELLGLADRVGARLRRGDLAARTVALKLRYDDFTTISRSRTLGNPATWVAGCSRWRRSCSSKPIRRVARCGCSVCAARGWCPRSRRQPPSSGSGTRTRSGAARSRRSTNCVQNLAPRRSARLRCCGAPVWCLGHRRKTFRPMTYRMRRETRSVGL